MKRTAGLSLMYGMGSIWQGMLLHPYVTMRRVMRMKGWWWAMWLPAMSLFGSWLLGFGGIRMWMWLRGEGREMWYVVKEGLMFGWWWWVWFCGWWQVLIGYLAMRFYIVTHDLE